MTVALARITWGDGPRRALLLHGIQSDANGWWRLGPDLAGHGWHVTAVDLRGHGASPRGDDYAIGAFRDDVLALAGPWDLLLGHSLGGTVALACMAGAPDLTRRLVLEDPSLSSRDAAVSLEELLAPFRSPITCAALAAEHPDWHPEDVVYKVGALLRTSPDVTEGVVAAGPWELAEVVRALPVPTLLLGADPARDPLVPPPVGEALAAANPQVVFRTVPGADHSIHRSAYPAFRDALLAFLEESGPPAAQ